jgi:hypothetical protein
LIQELFPIRLLSRYQINMINHPRLTEKCPINLLPHQVEHVQQIWNLLTKDCAFSYINTSGTGSGKTLTTLYLGWLLQKLYGTKIMIVAPSETSLRADGDSWLANAEEFGIKIEIATTYSALRGGQGSVSHPWLIPHSDKKKWKASPEFEELCAGGLFLIFDEFHNTKNSSITHYMAASLVRMAKKYRNVCRVALLSHTPGDKPEHLINILRMTGLVTATRMFKHVAFTSDYEWENYGLGELSRVCKKIANNNEAKRKIQDAMYRISAAKVNGICAELYSTYIRSKITFAMPIPEKKFNVTLLNAFLDNDEQSLELLNNGMGLLTGAVGWDPVLQQVAPQAQWNLGQLTIGLRLIEQGKLVSIANYVRSEAKKSPNKKFVISCGARSIKHHDMLASILFKQMTPDSYKDIITELRIKNENWKKLPKDMVNYISSFLNYSVPVDRINGQVPKSQRIEVIRKFQSPTNDSWCLLISPGTSSDSISLHDKHGNHPRELLTVADFYASRTTQIAGRINRVGMQSDAKIMIVYAKAAALETNILTSMLQKSRTARGILAENQIVILPAEYPYLIEGINDVALSTQLDQLGMQKYKE